MNQIRNLRLAVLLATALLLLALASGTGMLLQRLESSAMRAAEELVQRVARVMESTVNRHFLQVDGMLAGLPALLAPVARDGALSQPLATRMLRDLNFQNFNFRDLMLVLPDGQPWATALPASRQRRVPLDESVLAAAAGIGTVTIAGPVRNPLTGEWSLFFIRPLSLPGSGRMLALAEVPVPLIATLLSPVGEIPGLRLLLERHDGMMLASLPHDETRIGRPLSPPAGNLLHGGGVTTMPGRIGQQEVIFAVRPTLYRDILSVVTYELPAALGATARDRDRLLATALAAGLLLLALAFALEAALRQRERIEAERAHSRQILESAIDAMPDGFVMFDAEDRLVTCNSRFRDLYAISAPFIVPGATYEEIIRQGALRGQYPQAGPDIEAFVARMREFHRGNDEPMERLLPDGRWLLITERHIPGGGTVGIRTEITAMKQAMRDIAAARDAAAAATEAKSRFLARMSHELRTPLNGVLGLAQSLARDPALGEEQRRRAATLEQAGRHLLAVANDVLDLARVEAGRLELVPAPLHLPSLLEACASMTRPAAETKGITLALEVDTRLPAGVAADETRLRQLLLNLLSNAVKFTPQGGKVTLRALPLRPAAPLAGEDGTIRVRIEVADTGPGVPAAERQAVFGDFVQLGTQSSGAGLGLAIAHHIVDRMDGRIGCDSNPAPGGGALFWVELPLPLAEVAAPLPEPEAAEAMPPMRLLVADDVMANQAVLEALLSASGHAVTCVSDGAQAVAAVREAVSAGTPFDMVLMDVMMPGTDGLEATRQIRAMPGAAAAIPILAVTASAFPEDVAACAAAGMDGHLTKPIEHDALVRALKRLRRPGQGQVPAGPARLGAAPATAPGMLTEIQDHPLLTRRLDALIPGLDAATSRRLAPGFIAEIRDALEGLRRAKPEERKPLAHRLAGAAATLGAARLTQVARRLQSCPPTSPEAEPLARLAETTSEETLAALAPAAIAAGGA